MKYDWKVGETYKDKSGESHKFIAHVPDALVQHRLVFLKESIRQIVTRRESGTYYADEISPLDIIPPKRYVYVNIFDSAVCGVLAIGWSTQEEATRHRDDYSGFVRMEKIEV
jgi:hypothetical protein